MGVGGGGTECVGVGVGDGDAEGEAEADADGEADFEGLGLADFDGEAEGCGSAVGSRPGAGWMTGVGDGEWLGLTLGGAWLLLPVVAGAGAVAVTLCRWAASARTTCRPLTAISVALTAATTHTATAARLFQVLAGP